MKTIAILDYGAGNVFSVQQALKRIAVNSVLTQSEEVIRKADGLIIPGVGSAGEAMKKMNEQRWLSVIPTLTQPVLGICLGMQLMGQYSEEENTSCLDVLPIRTHRLKGSNIKVPHMGWNKVSFSRDPLFNGLKEGYVYFVHSYGVPISDFTSATVTYGDTFSAAIRKKNFSGVQFHPEKSGETGRLILQNFVKEVQSC